MHNGMGSASELISADEGGFVQLDFCRVTIPAEALAQDAVISITQDDPYYAVFVGPDGMQFAEPVMIAFNLEVYEDYLKEHGIDPDDLVVALRDEVTGQWLPLETIIVDDEDNDEGNTWAVTYTTHFSRYALAD